MSEAILKRLGLCRACGSGDIGWCQISVRPYCNECNHWAQLILAPLRTQSNDGMSMKHSHKVRLLEMREIANRLRERIRNLTPKQVEDGHHHGISVEVTNIAEAYEQLLKEKKNA